MRIISRGQVPETLPVQVECGHCKSQVEFLRSEGTRHEPHGMMGPPYFKFTCPVCQEAGLDVVITINEDRLKT